MRILIIGAGSAGRNLATKLCEEKHDVVMVDKSREALTEVEAQLDVLTVQGEGANPTILNRAGIDVSDLVVAVTNSDEVNILACMYAKAAGVHHKVARVVNSDYLLKTNRLDLREAGVDLLVSETEECSNDMFNILRMPGALETVDMLGGRVMVVGMQIHMDSPLLRAKIRDIPQPELLEKIRFIGLMRGDELIIPRGDTQPMVGDEIYFVGRPQDLTLLVQWSWPEMTRFEKTVVAGGGELGLALARKLEALEMQVVLVERDEERAEHCSKALNRALVIKGDALDGETLENCGITKQTAFAAVTGEDEKNIISCLLAGEMGAAFTLTQISKPQYVPVIDRLSLLDRAISSYVSMVNAILHFIRGKNVQEAAVLRRLPGELLEVVVSAGNRWAGKAIKDIRVPEGVLIATVMRGEEVSVATGTWVIAEGDRLVVFATPKATPKLASLFKA